MKYERITDKDMTLNLNVNMQQDMTKYFMFTSRLWELENKIERGTLGDTKQAVKEFAEKLKNNLTVNNTDDGYLNESLDYYDTMQTIDELTEKINGR